MDRLPVIIDIAIVARKQRLLLEYLNFIAVEDIRDKDLEEEFINSRLIIEDTLASMDSLVETLLSKYINTISNDTESNERQ